MQTPAAPNLIEQPNHSENIDPPRSTSASDPARLSKVPSSEPQATEFVSKTTVFYCIAAILAAIGIAALWHAFSLSTGDVGPGDRIPYLIGYYFWVPVLVYLVWRSALKRRRGAGLLLGSAAFMVIALYQSQSIIHEAQADRLALTKMHSMLMELMDGKVIDAAQLQDAGEYTPLLLTAQKCELRILDDFKKYQTQVVAANVGTMLSPQTLSSTTAIARTLVSLEMLRHSADQTEAEILKDYDGMPFALQSTSMPAGVRQSVMSGLDKGISSGKAAIREYFDIERHLLATATDTLNYMNGRQGFFVVRDNKLMFARHADLVAYNTYIAQIRAEAAQESAWRTAQRSSIAQKAQALEQEATSIGH